MHIHNELKIYQKTSSSLNFVYYKQIQQISRKKPVQIRRSASERNVAGLLGEGGLENPWVVVKKRKEAGNTRTIKHW